MVCNEMRKGKGSCSESWSYQFGVMINLLVINFANYAYKSPICVYNSNFIFVENLKFSQIYLPFFLWLLSFVLCLFESRLLKSIVLVFVENMNLWYPRISGIFLKCKTLSTFHFPIFKFPDFSLWSYKTSLPSQLHIWLLWSFIL